MSVYVLSFESRDITKKGDSFVYVLCALCASLVLVWVLSAAASLALVSVLSAKKSKYCQRLEKKE